MMCAVCGLRLVGYDDGGKRGVICLNGHDPDKKAQQPRRSQRVVDEHADGSKLERSFLTLWRQYGGPEPVREYEPFESRRFRLDFCWPERKVVVECEGFDHRKEQRYHSDVDKYNMLQESGWQLFRATSRLLRDDPGGFMDKVMAALRRAEGEA
jgi:hypothetical protein